MKAEQIVVAIRKCVMQLDRTAATTIGKEYEVVSVGMRLLKIKDDFNNDHCFDLHSTSQSYWGKYFKKKKNV